MDTLRLFFQERLAEIDAYLDLLSGLEAQIQEGPPRLGVAGPTVTTTQQRILYSSVYLQLYNLIEATITKCIDAVCSAISQDDRWHPRDLSQDLKREWVRYIARTHVELNYENRLIHSLELCEHLLRTLPISDIKIERGGGGNWDDEEIYRFATRLGCALAISKESNEAIKRPFKNDLGALALIVKLRNDLAHGSISFVECGDEVTAGELKELKSKTARYLEEVVRSFSDFIVSHAFLAPDRRPPAAA